MGGGGDSLVDTLLGGGGRLLSRSPGMYLTISPLSRKGGDSLVDTIGGGRLLVRSIHFLLQFCVFTSEKMHIIQFSFMKLYDKHVSSMDVNSGPFVCSNQYLVICYYLQ